MARNTPEQMRAMSQAQHAKMQAKLHAARVKKQEAAQSEAQATAQKAQATAVAAKAAGAVAAKSSQEKAIEAKLASDVQQMAKLMQQADAAWLAALKIFAKDVKMLESEGIPVKQTNFYKKLSKIDDVYEWMVAFTNTTIEVSKL